MAQSAPRSVAYVAWYWAGAGAGAGAVPLCESAGEAVRPRRDVMSKPWRKGARGGHVRLTCGRDY